MTSGEEKNVEYDSYEVYIITYTWLRQQAVRKLEKKKREAPYSCHLTLIVFSNFVLFLISRIMRYNL